MKYILNISMLCLCIVLLYSCADSSTTKQDEIVSKSAITYDSALAQKLGADDYGMHKYVIAFLKKGPNRNLDSAQAIQLQRAHLKNIERMANEGTLVLAGPFIDTGDFRGLYIFNVQSIEEAKALTQTDPAIQSGSLVMELKEWYGSAAILSVNDLHKKLEKKSISK